MEYYGSLCLKGLEIMTGVQAQKTEEEPDSTEDFCSDLQLKYEKVKDIFTQLSESQEVCKATQQAVKSFKAIETRTTEDSHILFDEIMDEKSIDEEKKRSLWESLKKLDFTEFRNFFRHHRVTKTVTIISPGGRTIS